MEIFIIGGGASGMAAAIKIAKKGYQVTILERNPNCGKKLALTGNGRCNFWNKDQDISHYHSENISLFKDLLTNKKDEVLTFFKQLGIVYKDINGYYYPFSNQAKTIINALLNNIKKLNINIITNTLVTEITKEDKFTIHTNDKTYQADKVIIATGSLAYPKTGSDGIGYNIAKNFGHKINKILPSLTALIGKDKFYNEWAGVRSEAILSLYENNRKIKEEQGEVQFTDYGISGICTFNLSSLIAKGLDQNKKEEIHINFVPWCKDNFISWLDRQNNILKDYTIKELLEGFLNYKIVNLILKLAKIKETAKWENINKEQLSNLITNFKIEIIKTKSFTEAQTCSGGIPLEEINLKTMESLKVKDLYFIGEIIDVNGDCGGYNLGFAWMSALEVGDSIND